MLRVLIVGPSPNLIGGQAVQAARLLAGLQKEESLEVSFVPANTWVPPLLEPIQRVKYLRTMITSLVYWFLLFWQVPRVDVVHAFSASYWSFLLSPLPAILVGKLFRKKTIINYRSGEAEDHLRRWPGTVRLLRLADEIVVPSRYLVDVFAGVGLHARAIPNFVDLGRFRYRKRKTMRPVFLSTRNLEPIYNVGCTILAFAEIQQHSPDASLLIVGRGSERSKLDAMVKKLQLRNVRFIGGVEPDQIQNFYDQADFFLNTPNIDNMPTSILEAFASGLPVVSTDAGGIPYIVEHKVTGLLATCNDHHAIARHATLLIDNPQLADDLATRAQQECYKFQWSTVRHEWMLMYQRLAGTPTLSPAELERAK